MSLVIKICGLKAPEALDAALSVGADMVGFVFFAPSPRNISFQTARALGQRVRGRAQKVALFVDPSDRELAASIEALEPEVLQLHGTEAPDRVAMIRERFGLPVMKALPIAQRSDLAAIKLDETVADRLIFDARAPREATRPGGLGQSFDWRLLENLNTRVPFMVSGGLDVSSGVERSPGEKDPEKIRAFIAAARRIASELNVASAANPKFARSGGKGGCELRVQKRH